MLTRIGNPSPFDGDRIDDDCPRHPRPASLLAAAILTLTALLSVPVSTEARSKTPLLDLRSAEAIATRPFNSNLERALKQWAEQASLPELIYVLRHSANELGAAEPLLITSALERTPAARPALRRRLLARLLRAGGGRYRFKTPELADLARDPPRSLDASVFRLATLLPDSGQYEAYSLALRRCVGIGLTDMIRPGPLEIAVQGWSTGEDRPDWALAAFDSAARGSGLLVGELLSVPTLVIATAARSAGLPLISPSAPDESIGALAPQVFQIGPSGYERGMRLAQAVLAGGPQRVGVLLSSAAEGKAFAAGFAAEATRRNGTLVWTDHYAPGTTNFGDAARAVIAKRVELLFWDGDVREVESLLRELARNRVSVRICGGEALSPSRHHTEARVLLEGVVYIDEEWRLSPTVESRLDSLVAEKPGTRASALALRGYLAGRLGAAAVASGALCPEEIEAFLATRLASDTYLRAHRFLGPGPEGGPPTNYSN